MNHPIEIEPGIIPLYCYNGDLSAYGLSCGYVQSARTENTKKELYKEGNVYHVRKFEFGMRTVWEGFERLKEARKTYRSI